VWLNADCDVIEEANQNAGKIILVILVGEIELVVFSKPS
jgi:hypothetical protein